MNSGSGWLQVRGQAPRTLALRLVAMPLCCLSCVCLVGRLVVSGAYMRQLHCMRL